LEDFIALGVKSENPARVACRCTVFTKSDMIHLQNKGEKLEDIIAGLHIGNASNYISTIVSNRTLPKPIILLVDSPQMSFKFVHLRPIFQNLLCHHISIPLAHWA